MKIPPPTPNGELLSSDVVNILGAKHKKARPVSDAPCSDKASNWKLSWVATIP